MDQTAIGAFIRARREALQPEDVGLRRGRRRTSGLRREELASLSDMSADYLPAWSGAPDRARPSS